VAEAKVRTGALHADSQSAPAFLFGHELARHPGEMTPWPRPASVS
jgi:hypothetical protein